MYNDQLNALAETALAVHNQWSAGNLMATPLGAIGLFSYPATDPFNTLEFYKAQSYSPFLRLTRYETWICSNTTFMGTSLDEAIAEAIQVCESVSQYLASNDFTEKSAGSIARLKRVTRAIKGEES